MIKSFEKVQQESTCQKRITVCEIYDENDILLSRESNRCNPTDGICSRLNINNTKSDYPLESCNWSHAEVNAIKALPVNSKPYKSILYGHDFYCQACEDALKNSGVQLLEIN